MSSLKKSIYLFLHILVWCVILTFIILTCVLFYKLFKKEKSQKISSSYNKLIKTYLVFAYIFWIAIIFYDYRFFYNYTLTFLISLMCGPLLITITVFYAELEVAK